MSMSSEARRFRIGDVIEYEGPNWTKDGGKIYDIRRNGTLVYIGRNGMLNAIHKDYCRLASESGAKGAWKP